MANRPPGRRCDVGTGPAAPGRWYRSFSPSGNGRENSYFVVRSNSGVGRHVIAVDPDTAGGEHLAEFGSVATGRRSQDVGDGGTIERVGQLADQLALDPGAADRHYVPDTGDVLWSSPLVDAQGRIKMEFTTPAVPGRYPILCTFPGHWRVMRAVLIVE